MQRKATRQSRGPNADEKRFQGWLKGRPGVTGGDGITEVHHCVGATCKRNKVHIGHWFAIPLSQSEHWLFHNRKNQWRDKNGPQSFLWEAEILEYTYSTGLLVPADIYDAIMDLGI